MTAEVPKVSNNGRYSVIQTAIILGVSAWTIWNHTEQGLLKCRFRKNGRKVYIGSEMLRCWNAAL